MEKLAIIGCGTMGHSIALQAVWSGLDIKMYGKEEEEIDNALKAIKAKLELISAHNLIDHNNIEYLLGRINPTLAIEEAVHDASFIIEVIPEQLELKKALFLYLDQVCGSHVILSSSTSGFTPSMMSSGIRHQERFIVAHFWNPAHLVPLVEIVKGNETSDLTLKRTLELLVRMNKKPVVLKKAIPGFIGNRLQYALFREAQYLLSEGIATVEDIDLAVTSGLGRRLPVTGPFLSADMGGLDIFHAICENLFKDLSNSGTAFPELNALVSDNHLGSKTGGGYYTEGKIFYENMRKEREDELIKQLKKDQERNNT